MRRVTQISRSTKIASHDYNSDGAIFARMLPYQVFLVICWAILSLSVVWALVKGLCSLALRAATYSICSRSTAWH